MKLSTFVLFGLNALALANPLAKRDLNSDFQGIVDNADALDKYLDSWKPGDEMANHFVFSSSAKMVAAIKTTESTIKAAGSIPAAQVAQLAGPLMTLASTLTETSSKLADKKDAFVKGNVAGHARYQLDAQLAALKSIAVTLDAALPDKSKPIAKNLTNKMINAVSAADEKYADVPPASPDAGRPGAPTSAAAASSTAAAPTTTAAAPTTTAAAATTSEAAATTTEAANTSSAAAAATSAATGTDAAPTTAAHTSTSAPLPTSNAGSISHMNAAAVLAAGVAIFAF